MCEQLENSMPERFYLPYKAKGAYRIYYLLTGKNVNIFILFLNKLHINLNFLVCSPYSHNGFVTNGDVFTKCLKQHGINVLKIDIMSKCQIIRFNSVK